MWTEAISMVVSFNISETSHSCSDSVVRNSFEHPVAAAALPVQPGSLSFAGWGRGSQLQGRPLLSVPVHDVQLYPTLLFVQLGENRALFSPKIIVFSSAWGMSYGCRLDGSRGLPWWLLQCRRPGFDPWVGKIPWRRAWQPTPVFLPQESYGQRSLAGYSPWGHKESYMTEAT